MAVFSEVLTCFFQKLCNYSMFTYFTNMNFLSFVRLQIESIYFFLSEDINSMVIYKISSFKTQWEECILKLNSRNIIVPVLQNLQ